jgi:bacteriophage N4 adsorption protein B
MSLPDFLAQIAGAMEALTAVLLVVILASSLDDAFLDVNYWVRRLRRPRGWPVRPKASAEALRALPEVPMAIMVPAWHESDVIAAMLDNLIRRQEYDDYVVFVGTYPNDPDTIAEVERMAALHPRVRLVDVGHPGPTCKADCLNSIVEEIFRHERVVQRRFQGIVMHDSEDVLHPLELRYFSAALAHFDMVQIPVVALERGVHALVAGTYMDEFAESHAKEMLVREALCGSIPSAGVGTCFSRAAIRALWDKSEGEPYRTDSLTEDYEIGMRLAEMGMRSSFEVVDIIEDGPGAPSQAHVPETERLLAVREFFPATFRAAYRQKARWILGIGLQSWHQMPLRGRSARDTYMMLHDRKGVVTAFVPPVAYLVLLYAALLEGGVATGLWPAPTGGLLGISAAWTALIYVNGILLAVRCAQRACFTASIYGWKQGVAAIPRMVVGNLVNCMAAARAWRLYLVHRLTRRPLAWDKTAHQFPGFPASEPSPVPVGMPLPAARPALMLVPASALPNRPASHPLPRATRRQGEHASAAADADLGPLRIPHP